MLLSKNVNQKFESKSQLYYACIKCNVSCYQRTLIKSLKANHNKDVSLDKAFTVVIKER